MRTIRNNSFYALLGIALIISIALMPAPALTQDATPTPITSDQAPQAPSRVEVQTVIRDEEIQTRLQDILTSTGWFDAPRVRVQDGVVFLSGQAQTAEYKEWAGNLTRNTQDVTAVVNQLEVAEPSFLDFQPFLTGLEDQGRSFLRSLPLIGFSLIVLFFTWILARLMTRTSRGYLQAREVNPLLLNVFSRIVGLMIFLGGLYVVLQMAGLTNIAFTILGGTGLLGLILGIAFRDISENFLASIFLSLQNPFNIGDLVEINNILGFVQLMNTRTTILMTLSGNHVQIPNATVYKSIIHNFTSNPNRRIDFTIGIGYDDSISLAQETIRKVLEDHAAVLNDPEHLVLVDNLGSSTLNLQIYFWIDGTQYSWEKVKSSVIRLVKHAIQDAGISMPDEAREIIFPEGVPIISETTDIEASRPAPKQIRQPAESTSLSTSAEGGLNSEAEGIKSQARMSRTPEEGENLLKSS